MTTISLTALNVALRAAGWHAEFKNDDQDNLAVVFFMHRPGQAERKFEFDPADTDDNGPWDDEGAVHRFPIDAEGVERELFALCKACQTDDENQS